MPERRISDFTHTIAGHGVDGAGGFDVIDPSTEQAFAHLRDHPRDLSDDVFRFDVDHAHARVRVLPLDNESQCGVEPFDTLESGGRLGQTAFEALPLVARELDLKHLTTDGRNVALRPS